jgi:nucleoside-diphosphate-sugar epimerase
MTVLILGAGGLLGQELVNSSQGEGLLSAPRDVDNKHEFLVENKISTIINLVASNPTSNQEEARIINHDYPYLWLESFVKIDETKKFWIQACSYFELQVVFGRMDPYTLEKNRFSQLLDAYEATWGFNQSKVYLPYLFGPREKHTRFIPTLIRELRSNSTARLTSGTQYLPLLSAIDASRIILNVASMTPGIYSAMPEHYSRVKEIALNVHRWIGSGSIIFDETKRSVDELYPKVDFPNPLNLETLINPLDWHIKSTTKSS